MEVEGNKIVTFKDIVKNQEIRSYISRGDELLGVLGYTEHSFVHAAKVAERGAYILKELNYLERDVELARIAGYTHDIGNMVNRVDHAQTGAIIAYNILDKLKMPPEEISVVISAIGNHDEGTGSAINVVSAALILADKTDVRRSRVRNDDFSTFDIHDRVNYAVVSSDVTVNGEGRTVQLDLNIDLEISSIMEYFEIFLTRMMMCRRAADFLKAKFELVMNGSKML